MRDLTEKRYEKYKRRCILISGDGEGRKAIQRELETLSDRIVEDPAAAALASVLHLPYTPFALAVRDGVVSGWATLREYKELRRMADAGEERLARAGEPVPVPDPVLVHDLVREGG